MTVNFPQINVFPPTARWILLIEELPSMSEGYICTRCLYVILQSSFWWMTVIFPEISPPSDRSVNTTDSGATQYQVWHNNVIFAPDVYGTPIFLTSAELFLMYVSPLSLQQITPQTDYVQIMYISSIPPWQWSRSFKASMSIPGRMIYRLQVMLPGGWDPYVCVCSSH